LPDATLTTSRKLSQEENKEITKRIFRSLRQAVNSLIQGTAASLVNRAMIKLDDELVRNKLDASILLQIHDEIVVRVQKDQTEEVSKLMKSVMENVSTFKVPMQVTAQAGDNLSEVK